MHFTRRQSPNNSRRKALRSRTLSSIVCLAGGLTAFGISGAPDANAATAKQATPLVIARLDKGCAALAKYDTASSPSSATAGFRTLVKLFTTYSTSLKTITPLSAIEADALKQLRNYVAFAKAESTVLLKLASSKKTAQAASDRTITFFMTADALSVAIRSTFASVSLPLCEAVMLDGIVDATESATNSSSTDALPVDVNSAIATVLNQPAGENGRLEVSEVYFPVLSGLSYRTTPEFDAIANQVSSATKNIYAAVSVREIVDSTLTRFCIIAGFQFASTVDQPTRTRAVNTGAAALNTKEVAPINGYRVFIGGEPQFDKAFLSRGDVFLEFTFPPTSDRAPITKFVGEFALKLPAA